MPAQGQIQTGLHSEVLFNKTEGLNNKFDPMRVGEDSLVFVDNAVIDLSGSLTRRNGYTLLNAGSFHSLFSCGKYGFCVFNGDLCLIKEDLSLTSLVSIGYDDVCYVKSFDGIYDVVYFSNGKVVGKLIDKKYFPWTLSSYVGIDSTDSKVLDYFPSPLAAKILEVYNARMYYAMGNYLFYSVEYDFARILHSSAFIFDSTITMVIGLNSSLFVGTTTKLIYLKGDQPNEMPFVKVYDLGVIPGSSIKVNAASIGLKSVGDVVVFSLSNGGICMGDDSGEVTNMTELTVDFPDSSNSACYVNKDNQYIISIGE